MDHAALVVSVQRAYASVLDINAETGRHRHGVSVYEHVEVSVNVLGGALRAQHRQSGRRDCRTIACQNQLGRTRSTRCRLIRAFDASFSDGLP